MVFPFICIFPTLAFSLPALLSIGPSILNIAYRQVKYSLHLETCISFLGIIYAKSDIETSTVPAYATYLNLSSTLIVPVDNFH